MNMQVSGLFVYPVKGMAGIALKSAQLEERGIYLDRRWMLIDEQDKFISQRNFAELALFKLEIYESHLKVIWKNEQILIPFDEKEYPDRAKVLIWKDEVEATLIASESINSWFSERTGIPCKLAYQGAQSIRFTSAKYASPQKVSFADGYPFLMISEESLEQLNGKLKHPVEMSRFRPNLIIKGANPHIEDEYHYYKVGDVLFKAVKKCSRCNVITIDQTTAQKGSEPLITLATYRLVNKKVTFGQNLLLQNPGHYTIKIGDTVEFSDKKIQNDQSSDHQTSDPIRSEES